MMQPVNSQAQQYSQQRLGNPAQVASSQPLQTSQPNSTNYPPAQNSSHQVITIKDPEL